VKVEKALPRDKDALATGGSALVTGASAGIGLEIARLLAEDGLDLILVARRKERLDQLAAELIESHGIRARVFDEDLSDRHACFRIESRLRQRGAIPDVLVNNAGFGARGRHVELGLERQISMLDVNVVALTLLTRLLLPHMLERGRGTILNVASTAAFQPGPNMAVYYASKAYVVSYSEALAEELRGSKVTVSCLCPGPTETEFREVAGMGDSLLFRLGTMDASRVARTGVSAMRRKKSLAIPGLVNRAGVVATRLAPRLLVRRIVARLQS
jgi:short-subunit dehydrogenase